MSDRRRSIRVLEERIEQLVQSMIKVKVSKWVRLDNGPTHTEEFDYLGVLHEWSREGADGEVYVVGIVEKEDGTFETVSSNLITRVK